MTDPAKVKEVVGRLAVQPTVHLPDMGPGTVNVAAGIRQLMVDRADALAVIESLSAEIAAANDEIYAPGEFRCVKCGFVLSQFQISASTGVIGDRDEPGEKCPNDGSPLWRVTWKQRAEEHYNRAAEEIARVRKLEAEITALREGGDVGLETTAVVPKEPTKEQYAPNGAATSFAHFMRFGDFVHCYRAMLSAAPARTGQPEPQTGTGSEKPLTDFLDPPLSEQEHAEAKTVMATLRAARDELGRHMMQHRNDAHEIERDSSPEDDPSQEIALHEASADAFAEAVKTIDNILHPPTEEIKF